MILGIGIDIIELNRIEKMINGKLNFIERILTETERDVVAKLKGEASCRICSWKICGKRGVF